MRAEVPVIVGEDASVWEAHRAGIVGGLAPAGAIEEALAQRIALVLWRLARVVRYETLNIETWQERIDQDIADAWRFSSDPYETTAHGRTLEAVRERAEMLADEVRILRRFPALPDDRRVTRDDALTVLNAVAYHSGVDCDDFDYPPAVGIPDDATLDSVTGWTAGRVRIAAEALFAAREEDEEEFASVAEILAHEAHRKVMEGINVGATLRRWEQLADRMRRERTLPHREDAEKVMRYEAHLHRQLMQTLHELEAMQARRAGQAAPLARLDVQGLEPTG
jgi:hypothetical protein